MAEDATVTSSEEPDAPPPEPTPDPGSKLGAIYTAVNEALAKHQGDGTTRQAVVDHLVQEQLDKRKTLLLSGIAKVREVKQEIGKIEKGGNKTYGLDGKVAGTTYSKQDAEAYKKAKERLAKLEKGVEDAIDKGDYKKLEECCK